MVRTTAPATATEEDLVVENPELVKVRRPQSLVLSLEEMVTVYECVREVIITHVSTRGLQGESKR